MGLINREDFEQLAESMKDGLAKNRSFDFCSGFAFALELLRTMPEQKQDRIVGVAEWVPADLDPDFITCSNCKALSLKLRMAYKPFACEAFKFCPNCGQKIKQGGDKNGDQGAG